jgi:hypothetical protein
VRWQRVTFANFVDLVAGQVPGVPAGAARSLATVFFMCLPLPDAWAKALTHLRRLTDYSDHPRLLAILGAYEALYDEERDRLWRTRGDLQFSSFRVLRQRPASTRTRRRLLVFYGVEMLRAEGLPLESKGGVGAYDVMRQAVHRFWPTEIRGVAKVESIERAYFRGKEEAQKTRFESRSQLAEPASTAPEPAAGTRYPTPEEFRLHISALYTLDDVAWIPVPDDDRTPAPAR